MLYKLAKGVMATAMPLFYRRVYITGLEVIPTSGPAILIANHTSSLMDAAILGILIDRPIHSFARGDIFSQPLAAKLLHALNMIPVHHHEARNSLNSNNDSFVKAQQLLMSQIVLYFPEGHSHIERTLYAFRKGIFRLAFQAAASHDFSRELPIIPVGIHYAHPTAYQSDVIVTVGKPLLVSNYKDEFRANPKAALLQLTRDCYGALKREVLHIDSAANYPLADTCLEIKRNDYHSPGTRWLEAGPKRFEEEKNICRCINQMQATEIALLRAKLTRYAGLLARYGLTDEAMSPAFRASSTAPWMVALAAGLPVFVVGYLLNALPILLARRIVDKKVYRIDYYSWVFVAGAAIMHVFWMLTLFFSYSLINWQYAIIICLLALGSGAFALQYLKWWRVFRLSRARKRAGRKKPGTLEQLQEERGIILEMIGSRTGRPITTANA